MGIVFFVILVIYLFLTLKQLVVIHHVDGSSSLWLKPKVGIF